MTISTIGYLVFSGVCIALAAIRIDNEDETRHKRRPSKAKKFVITMSVVVAIVLVIEEIATK